MQLLLLGETSWTRVLVLILVRRWVVVVVLCNDYIDGLINLKFGDWFPKRYMWAMSFFATSAVSEPRTVTSMCEGATARVGCIRKSLGMTT